MKWFKHDSNASTDAKLRRVRMKYGMEGYGLYWYCLELIASEVDAHNLTFELEHDAEIIAFDTGIHRERIEEMMRHFVESGLFEESGGRVTCLKMANRTDEYIGKLLRTTSGQHPDKHRIKSRLIEENREDKTREEKRREETPEKPIGRKACAVVKKPDDVDDQVWSDFLSLRKTKKAPVTKTALSGIRNQAAIAGYTMNQALAECSSRGWTGFKAEWVANKPAAGTESAAERIRRKALEREAAEGCIYDHDTRGIGHE